VEAMWLMLQQEKPDDYVIATGESHTVREFLDCVFRHAGLGNYEEYVQMDARYFRPHEVPYLLGDASKAQKNLNWTPTVSFEELACMMYNEDLKLIKGEKNETD
jgi:GDPmannose 4,6-dehydratase